MTWGAVVVVAAVAGIAAFNQAICGFGFALLVVPLLSLATTASHAVVAVSLLTLPMSIVMAVRYHDHVDRHSAWVIALAGLAGMPLGLVVLSVVSDSALRLIIGAVVLVLATVIASGFRVTRGAHAVNVVSGFAGGVLSTSTGTNGPPLVLGLRAQGLSAQEFRSTLSALFVVSGTVTILLFTAAGRVDGDALAITAIGYPFVALGWVTGDRLAPRVDERFFARLVVVLLYASALGAVVSAVFH
jgi:uncharacterized protein